MNVLGSGGQATLLCSIILYIYFSAAVNVNDTIDDSLCIATGVLKAQLPIFHRHVAQYRE